VKYAVKDFTGFKNCLNKFELLFEFLTHLVKINPFLIWYKDYFKVYKNASSFFPASEQIS